MKKRVIFWAWLSLLIISILSIALSAVNLFAVILISFNTTLLIFIASIILFILLIVIAPIIEAIDSHNIDKELFDALQALHKTSLQ